MTKQCHSNPQC